MRKQTISKAFLIAALKFFNWAFMQGDHLVGGLDFVRLPDPVQARIYVEMLKVTDQDGKPLHWPELYAAFLHGVCQKTW